MLIIRVGLALVFALAGFAKLVDLPGSRSALKGFGVPERLAGTLGTVLPLVEIVVAAALLSEAAAWYGALGALVLLSLFLAGIGAAMGRGESPDCHCFGQLHSEPAGVRTLARNGFLAALALLVVAHHRDDVGGSAIAWIGALSRTDAILLCGGAVVAAALCMLASFSLALFRQNGRLLRRMDALEARLTAGGLAPVLVADPSAPGLPVGSRAPDFSLPGVRGELATLASLRAGAKSLMLVFADPGCGPCNALMPELAAWQREHARELVLAMISTGPHKDNRAKAEEHGLINVLVQEDREVADAYKSVPTPSAVLIDDDGRVASPPCAGADAIRTLLAQAIAAPPHRVRVLPPDDSLGGQRPTHGALTVGDSAPDVVLRDLNGRPRSVAETVPDGSVLLFWRLSCGFCEQLVGDLKSLERQAGPGTPRLVLVSTSEPGEDRALGLHATILRDADGTAMRAFGVTGTPTAIQLDHQARVQSPPAVGAPDVLALLRRTSPGGRKTAGSLDESESG